MSYPNKIQSDPSLGADQPVFYVPVPNYNTQRPRVQNKKRWWRWDFVRRWREVIGGGNVPMSSSPVSIPLHEEPLDCPQCGTAWRLEPGLCVNCLLSRGLDAEMPDGQTLADVLDQIDMHDGD